MMVHYGNLTARRLIELIDKYRGNVSTVAAAIHCSRQTVYNYIKKHSTVQAALENARELMIDSVEDKLYSAALNGEAWAVCFFLKTQAKHRGYVERAETNIDGDLTIKVIYGNSNNAT